MKWQGLNKTKILKTFDDVLEHSYGVKPEDVSVDVSFEEEPEEEPEEVSEDESKEEPEETSEEKSEAVEYISGPDSELSEEEYAQYLVDSFKKDELIAIAAKLELNTEGNKADIAVRITSAEFSSK